MPFFPVASEILRNSICPQKGLNSCFLFEVRNCKYEVGINQCMHVFMQIHTWSHLIKEDTQFIFHVTVAWGSRCQWESAFLAQWFSYCRAQGQHGQWSLLCWDSAWQTVTGVKQFMSSLKPNSGKYLCNISYILNGMYRFTPSAPSEHLLPRLWH